MTTAEPNGAYWGSLPAAARAGLTAIGTHSTFTPGRVLLAQQDNSRDVVVVWSGMVKAVVRSAAGQQVVLALRGPGDILGEIANISGGPRTAAVVAVNRVNALVIPGDPFAHFLDSYPAAADSVYRTILDRLREADRDRLAAATMSVGQRLARMLLKLAARHGVPAPDGSLVIERLSQEDLAACIGCGARTAARQIAVWRDRHIISTERLAVTVYKPHELERVAGRHTPPP
jgi:CRP/FNR family transcriptional regulator, cyclic AMP receptor protein